MLDLWHVHRQLFAPHKSHVFMQYIIIFPSKVDYAQLRSQPFAPPIFICSGAKFVKFVGGEVHSNYKDKIRYIF